MQLAKINGRGPGWRRKTKMAIIYRLMLGKLMLVAPHFVYIASYKIKHATKSTEHLSSKKNYLTTTLDLYAPHSPHSNHHTNYLTTIDSSSEISTCTPLARECTIPYGVAENVHTTAACPSLKENTSHPIVSVSDRKHHLEVYIFIFCCRKFVTAISRP